MAKGITHSEYVNKLNIDNPTIVLVNNAKYVNSRLRITVRCTKCNNIWSPIAGHLINNNVTGCPSCSITARPTRSRISAEEWMTRSKNKRNNNYTYDLSLYVNQTTDTQLICPKHGAFLVNPLQHMHHGSGCKSCAKEQSTSSSKRITQEEFLRRIENKFPGVFDLSAVIYTNQNSPITVHCIQHNKDLSTIPKRLFLGVSPCAQCRDTIMDKGTKFILKANSVHNDYYSYDKLVYTSAANKITITCPKHGDFTQRADTHLAGHGCLVCGNNRRSMTQDEFVKQVKVTHPELICDERTVYLKQDGVVIVKCPKHGYFDKIASDLLRQPGVGSGIHGCTICTSPAGEKRIIELLNKHHITHKRQYVIQVSGTRYRYDFYIPGVHLLIEYDEEHHDIDIHAKRDIIKRTLAEQYGYKLERIPEIRAKELESYLLYVISKYGKYKYGPKFYNSIMELCKDTGLYLPMNKVDFKKYLVYDKTKKFDN